MDYRRLYTPGGNYFFTVVTAGRKPLLITHIDRLRWAFRRVAGARPFAIEAMVVLPDHLHALWRLPDGDHDFSTRWKQIKHAFSAGFGERRPWQARYWEHLIRDEADWRRHMDYIHFNPVRHGYASSPADWPYSSFRRAVTTGMYDPSWGRQEPPELAGMNPE